MGLGGRIVQEEMVWVWGGQDSPGGDGMGLGGGQDSPGGDGMGLGARIV